MHSCLLSSSRLNPDDHRKSSLGIRKQEARACCVFVMQLSYDLCLRQLANITQHRVKAQLHRASPLSTAALRFMPAGAGVGEYTARTSGRPGLQARLDALGKSLAKTLGDLEAVNWSDPGTVNSLNKWIRSERATDGDRWNPLLLIGTKQQDLDKVARDSAQIGAF